MKLGIALAGAAMLAFAWLALRTPSDVAAPAVIVQATTAAAPAVPPAAARAPDMGPPAPRGIRVHGVLYRGERDAASQALLSIEGRPTHVFKVGEPVAQGWSVDAIASDHVVLAHGGARARLDVSYSVAAPTEAAGGGIVKAVAREDRKDEPVAGFMPAGAAAGSPRLGPPGPANLAANRKFAQDMQQRAAQRP
jgi:hypothetical protein